jgi:hypothetical protein
MKIAGKQESAVGFPYEFLFSDLFPSLAIAPAIVTDARGVEHSVGHAWVGDGNRGTRMVRQKAQGFQPWRWRKGMGAKRQYLCSSPSQSVDMPFLGFGVGTKGVLVEKGERSEEPRLPRVIA